MYKLAPIFMIKGFFQPSCFCSHKHTHQTKVSGCHHLGNETHCRYAFHRQNSVTFPRFVCCSAPLFFDTCGVNVDGLVRLMVPHRLLMPCVAVHPGAPGTGSGGQGIGKVLGKLGKSRGHDACAVVQATLWEILMHAELEYG